MKIVVRFKNSKNSKLKYFQPSTIFYSKDCSSGPVLSRGYQSEVQFEVKEGDILEFSTTKFTDEFEFKHFRGERLLNGPTKGH